MIPVRIGTLVGGLAGLTGLALGAYFGMGEELSHGEPLAVGAVGLNIVILPALGPDKQSDPVFELGGGRGQGIAESAGGLALSSLRQNRDYVLIDQRGTGWSNPLDCNLYGNPDLSSVILGNQLHPSRRSRCEL